MAEPTTPFTAIILAGKRPGKDPVAEAAGVACKSFAPIGGRPMVHRVLDALEAARQVGPRILCGPSQSLIAHEPELKARLETGEAQMDCQPFNAKLKHLPRSAIGTGWPAGSGHHRRSCVVNPADR